MESGPPLNLSTSIKVESSVAHSANEEGSSHVTVKRELIPHTDGDQSYLLLQPLTNDSSEVLTITGEAIKESIPQQDSSSKETNHDGQENNHERKKTYKCSHCTESFFRANQLRMHEKSHIEEKVHGCDQCHETFPRLSLLLRHKQEHTKKVYECPECDLSLSTYNSFRVHLKKHKGGKKFKCPECSMTFVQHSHFITHLRKHTGEKPFVCHICNNRFKQVSHLTTHLRTHTKVKPYICEFCNASFSQTGSLKRHRRSHTGEKPYQCNKCDSLFVEKRNLNRHLLSHSGIRPFKCDLCSASFTQLIDLKRHKFSHTGFKPFKCDVCEAAFSRKNNLKWHKLTHEGDTPHKCEICNVGFRIVRDLKNHKKYHVDNKPYSCEHCKASFVQLSTLKRHINVHSGNRPYSCEICKATFFEKSSLKRHIQRHDAVKPFSCERCVMSFLDARTLRRHKIVVHNDGKYEDNDAKSENSAYKGQHPTKEISPSLEEENSLHIYEPSYHQKVPEPNLLIPTPVSEIAREQDLASQPVCQVVVSETSSDGGPQGPTLVLSQPGQPPKTARPADNCQNHNSHVHTFLEGNYGQWQSWCFCDTPNIPIDDPLRLPVSESHSLDISESGNGPVLIEHRQLNYQDMPQAIPNSLDTLQTSLNTNPDSHQPLSTEQNDLQLKGHSVPPNVFQAMGNSHSPNEFHTATSTYSQFNNSLNYNGEISMAPPENNETGNNVSSLHQTDQRNAESRNLPVIVDKSSYTSVHGSDGLESNTYFAHYKKDCQEKILKHKAEDQLEVSENEIARPYMSAQRLECTTFEQQQVFASVDPQKNEKYKKDQNAIRSNNQNEVEEFSGTHLVSIEQDPCYKDQTSLKPQEYNYVNKHSKTVDMVQQPILMEKGKDSRLEMVPPPPPPPNPSTVPVTTPQSVVVNNLQNQKYANNIPAYQLAVYDPLTQVVSSDSSKEQVTLQYSLTVNNPATGDIQIQSDMFPAKTEEISTKRPIKKRRVSKQVEEKERKHVCNICSKTFQIRTQLELHRRKHTGEKPFVCRLCSQSFSHSNSLTIHMRSHTGERPFVCTYCGATFTQKSNLGVHHRVHTGEKPFKCDVCETSFSQGSHLIAHKRIHNNDRPFVCSTCGQAFTQRSALKRHEIKHSGIKPHSCDICDSKFSQKEDLKRHSATHNNGNPKGKEVVSKKVIKAIYKRYGEKLGKKKIPKKDDQGVKLETDVDESKSLSQPEINCEETKIGDLVQIDNRIKAQAKKNVKKESANKGVKGKSKDSIEPVRTSKRIKEAAEKKKFKVEHSDFITGDLEEIDKVEELENELIKVSRSGPGGANWKKKDAVASKLESEVVQSWCFCEVPHGPNEPHTHSETSSKFNSEYSTNGPSAHMQPETSSSILVDGGSCKDGVLQFSLPQLSHAVVLQGDQVALHPSQQATVNNPTHISLNSESIVMNSSGIPEPQILSSSINGNDSASLGNQYISSADQVVTSQDVHNGHVLQDDGKSIYGTAQIISGQVLPSSHFVTSEGTFFFEASDIINNGAVVLNSSPGTFFFDLSTEGQILNVPISANVAHDSVIVAGSSSLESSSPSAPNEAIYSTSAEPNPSSTISFSVRDSHANPLLESAAAQGSTILGSAEMNGPNILSSSDSNITSVGGEQNSSCSSSVETAPVQYSRINSSEVRLFNNIPVTIESSEEIASPSAVSESFKESEETKSPLVVQSSSKCSVCGNEFEGKSTLKQHMRFSHPGLHVCNVCFDAFTTKEHLNTHKLQHKPSHSCPECLMLFTNKVTLNQHRQKIHKVTGLSSKKTTRSFSCGRCRASFFQLSDLNRHLLGHTGEKPFKCKHCGACFTRKSSLNKHERIHTGEKPYTCKECGLSFAYRYQINRHRSEHKEEPNNFSMPYVLT